MSYITTLGLVLREVKIKENDSLLTVLTRDHGKLTLKARGVRSKSSKIRSACQLFTYSEFTIFEYKGYYTINEAESLEQFSGLRQDLELISLASYFSQLAETLSDEDSPSPQLLQLTLNSLYALASLKKPQALVKAAFELRLMCIAGYEPSLEGCAGCGDEGQWLNVTMGALFCDHCRPSEGVNMPLCSESLSALRYVVSCDSKRLFSFTISDSAMKRLSQAAEMYLLTQLERGFSTLDFYNSLIIM